MSRTFMVYVNVDDLNASLVGLFTNEEKSHWVAGFQAGCSGVKAGAWPPAMLAGHAVGLNAYQASEDYRAKKSQAGSKSADVRARKTGTAQPTKPKQRLSIDRTAVEQCSSNVRTTPELSNSQYLLSSIEKPKANSATEHDPEDIFQPAQPQTAKPAQPKATPQDILAACGYALDWFRGSESGRQEAHDAMTGALALYDPHVIQQVLRDEFKARKAKVHISHLLGLLDARTYVEQAPPGERERMAAEKAAKEVRCADLRARLARVWPGDAEWERVTGRKMSLHGAQGACDFAANWIQEQLTEHFGEAFA